MYWGYMSIFSIYACIQQIYMYIYIYQYEYMYIYVYTTVYVYLYINIFVIFLPLLLLPSWARQDFLPFSTDDLLGRAHINANDVALGFDDFIMLTEAQRAACVPTSASTSYIGFV